jgi:histidine triad (HIT) family protein
VRLLKKYWRKKNIYKAVFTEIVQPMEDKTIFEKIIAGEIIADILFEDEAVAVIRDINPQAPIHVLIVPKKRIPNLGEAENADVNLLGRLLLVAKNFARSNGLQSFRIVINCGRQAGETVPHLHLHLLSGRAMEWPPG